MAIEEPGHVLGLPCSVVFGSTVCVCHACSVM